MTALATTSPHPIPILPRWRSNTNLRYPWFRTGRVSVRRAVVLYGLLLAAQCMLLPIRTGAQERVTVDSEADLCFSAALALADSARWSEAARAFEHCARRPVPHHRASASWLMAARCALHAGNSTAALSASAELRTRFPHSLYVAESHVIDGEAQLMRANRAMALECAAEALRSFVDAGEGGKALGDAVASLIGRVLDGGLPPEVIADAFDRIPVHPEEGRIMARVALRLFRDGHRGSAERLLGRLAAAPGQVVDVADPEMTRVLRLLRRTSLRCALVLSVPDETSDAAPVHRSASAAHAHRLAVRDQRDGASVAHRIVEAAGQVMTLDIWYVRNADTLAGLLSTFARDPDAFAVIGGSDDHDAAVLLQALGIASRVHDEAGSGSGFTPRVTAGTDFGDSATRMAGTDERSARLAMDHLVFLLPFGHAGTDLEPHGHPFEPLPDSSTVTRGRRHAPTRVPDVEERFRRDSAVATPVVVSLECHPRTRGRKVARFAARHMRASRAVVVAPATSAARDIATGFLEETEQAAITVDRMEWYADTDAALERCLASLSRLPALDDPDAVLVIALGDADRAAVVTRFIRQRRPAARLLGTGEWPRGVIADDVFSSRPVWIETEVPEAPVDEHGRRFLETYTERTGRPASSQAVRAGDAVFLIAQLASAGAMIPELVRDFLPRSYIGITSMLDFGSNGRNHGVTLIEQRDGRRTRFDIGSE